MFKVKLSTVNTNLRLSSVCLGFNNTAHSTQYERLATLYASFSAVVYSVYERLANLYASLNAVVWSVYERLATLCASFNAELYAQCMRD